MTKFSDYIQTALDNPNSDFDDNRILSIWSDCSNGFRVPYDSIIKFSKTIEKLTQEKEKLKLEYL